MRSFDEFQVLKSSSHSGEVSSVIVTGHTRKSVEGNPSSASLAVPPRIYLVSLRLSVLICERGILFCMLFMREKVRGHRHLRPMTREAYENNLK